MKYCCPRCGGQLGISYVKENIVERWVNEETGELCNYKGVIELEPNDQSLSVHCLKCNWFYNPDEEIEWIDDLMERAYENEN